MKDRYVWLFALFCILLVALSAANAYVSYRNNDKTEENIKRSIALYGASDTKATADLIAEAVADIRIPEAIQGPRGNDGKPGESVKGDTGEKGDSGVVDYNHIESYIDRRIAEKLSELPKPKDGRTPVINIDPDTGDVLLKYQGDTLWTLLMEKCELVGACE